MLPELPLAHNSGILTTNKCSDTVDGRRLGAGRATSGDARRGRAGRLAPADFAIQVGHVAKLAKLAKLANQ
jgi:hypothetical protein